MLIFRLYLLATYSFSILSLFNLNKVEAAEIKDIEGKSYLFSKKINELYTEATALAQWKMRLDSGSLSITQSPIQKEDGFYLPLSSFVPHIFSEFFEKKFRGPNCYNTALVSQGVLKQLTFTSQNEIIFYLNHLFEPIHPFQALQPGDMGVIFQPSRFNPDIAEIYPKRLRPEEKQPVHAFTYISKDLIFEKAGSKDFHPIHFDSYHGVTQDDYEIHRFSTWIVFYRRIPGKSIESFTSSPAEAALFRNFMDQIEVAAHSIHLAEDTDDEGKKIQEFLTLLNSVLAQVETGTIHTRDLIQALLHRIESVSLDQELWATHPADLKEQRFLHHVKRIFQKMKNEYQISSENHLNLID